jgi:hypothetical protein
MATVIDEIIDLHDRIIGKLFNTAKHKHAEHFQASGKAINDKVRLWLGADLGQEIRCWRSLRASTSCTAWAVAMPPGDGTPRSYWTGQDEILRLATSIKPGSVTASLMLRKLGSNPRQNGLAVALRELGRIERTLFIQDWLQSVELPPSRC